MFDGSGYRVWARQLQLYLEAKDAWGAVLKTTLTSLQLRMESPTKLTVRYSRESDRCINWGFNRSLLRRSSYRR
ncbi:hypothetical protein PF008_g2686 [Phytophthora fragariae]|uniref:DUF4219 domain-containing protein n=1 Tax=Phytophthora fragariae TaxID=53985 RepID=A0A6G0SH37_9STRA|nr:hypothetical protein PF008_g2686 [Phytophthora fragariae]